MSHTPRPQCETAIECLEELARVMEQFRITSMNQAIRSSYVECGGRRWILPGFPLFNIPTKWRFAVAAIEGKPVFVGNKLFDKDGREVFVTKTGVDYRDAEGHLVRTVGFAFGVFPHGEYFWTAPKKARPETVMVELRTEVAKRYMLHIAHIQEVADAAGDSVEIAQACKLALEKLGNDWNDCVCKDDFGNPPNQCDSCPR